jgi:hypothetical protein
MCITVERLELKSLKLSFVDVFLPLAISWLSTTVATSTTNFFFNLISTGWRF